MGIMTLLFLDRAARAAARGALEGDGRRLDRESLQYINRLGGEHSVVTGRRPHMAANTGHLARSSSSYMICEKGGGSACGEKALHMLCKGFSVVPHGFYICLESFLN